MKLKYILCQIYADKSQIFHCNNLLMASIFKPYQMRDQQMSTPSEQGYRIWVTSELTH